MAPPERRRRAVQTVALLAVASVLGHAVLLDHMEQALRSERPLPPMERMTTTFTRVLLPSAPPRVGRAPPSRERPRHAPTGRAVDVATSAPEEPASNAVPEPAAAHPPASDAEPAVPVTAPVTVAEAPASAAVEVAASAPSVGSVEAAAQSGVATGGEALVPGGSALRWPRSTRLSYALGGWYRGEVHGQASVEWLRRGDRYQVHLEVQIGPKLAPWVSRRLSSEGRLSDAQGLQPERFEQDTRQMFTHQRVQIAFDDQGVRMGHGPRVPAEAGVQDSASQFIQMMYLFTVQPEKARPGTRIDLVLALPSRMQRWSYRVGQMERVETAQGPVEALHVAPLTSGRGVLSAEVWYAPSWQWLPVRMKMKHDDETWVDLQLVRPPEQE